MVGKINYYYHLVYRLSKLLKEMNIIKSKHRNVLKEMGYSQKEIDKKIKKTWNTIFVNPASKLYFEASHDMGYIVDTGNTDVRTEGQSYGMMLAVQMNQQDVFDRIWKWTNKYMLNKNGPYAGYYSWHCSLDGEKIDEGPAPDGEEYFAMALILASRRWGDSKEKLFNYSQQAKDLLSVCINKDKNDEKASSMWNRDNYLIKFVPDYEFTNPSYHLPHFYEVFSKYSNEEDKTFWKKAAQASRSFIPKACNSVTGMNPEYANYDGTPNSFNNHGDFYSDSYRLAANIGLDSLWNGQRKEYETIINNLLTYFSDIDIKEYKKYKIDGTEREMSALHPLALLATNAMGTLATTNNKLTRKTVQLFFETPLREGNRRYYDNMLYFFSLLALSGNYRQNWE